MADAGARPSLVEVADVAENFRRDGIAVAGLKGR